MLLSLQIKLVIKKSMVLKTTSSEEILFFEVLVAKKFEEFLLRF